MIFDEVQPLADLIRKYPDLIVEILGSFYQDYAVSKDVDSAILHAICEWDLSPVSGGEHSDSNS